jgi:hypothetical protein
MPPGAERDGCGRVGAGLDRFDCAGAVRRRDESGRDSEERGVVAGRTTTTRTARVGTIESAPRATPKSPRPRSLASVSAAEDHGSG